MDRYLRKIQTFIEMGKLLEPLSVCLRARVAAIIFPFECSAIYALGYNGPASGEAHDNCDNTIGTCGCIHAEANAIAKFNNDLARPSILFTTRCPCRLCAGLIINTLQIKLVIFETSHSDNTGFARLFDSRVHILKSDHIVSNFQMIKAVRHDNI